MREVRDLGLLVLFLRNFPEFGYLVITGQDVHRIPLVPQPGQVLYLLINITPFQKIEFPCKALELEQVPVLDLCRFKIDFFIDLKDIKNDDSAGLIADGNVLPSLVVAQRAYYIILIDILRLPLNILQTNGYRGLCMGFTKELVQISAPSRLRESRVLALRQSLHSPFFLDQK